MLVIDDFLPEKEFKSLEDLIFSTRWPWYYNQKTLEGDHPNDGPQFVHSLHVGGKWVSPASPYFQPLFQRVQPLGVAKAKLNLSLKTEKVLERPKHVDIENFRDISIHLLTAIYYLNSNDGYTHFEDNSVVESVANRIVLFPVWLKHGGTTCSNQDFRCVFNLNFLPSPEGLHLGLLNK